ncbi:uncharacterized protein LOC143522871 [Brachyhypopomus gauderio]|uniref:uncharacterized protein LOC143522871 n=1 Tax=Brachyhypopomus gauderio TaxID=698409 RepID=UPI004041650B
MLKLPEKTDSKTDTKILLEAISKDKVHLARFILDALDGKIVDSKGEGAQTPLISSVSLPDSHARSKFMDLLLQKGANVNYQDESGRTALSYACEKGYLDAVKMLVKHNADPEMVDTWGNTALMYAAVAGHSVIVEFLVRAFKRLGLQVDRQNRVGNSAVEVAKYLGHTECLSALLCNSKKVHNNDALCEVFGHLNASEERCENEQRQQDKLGVTQKKDFREVTPQSKSSAVDGMRLQFSSSRTRALVLRGKMRSVDSIEFQKEGDGLFSGVFTPKPPQRCRAPHYWREETDTCINVQLPPLSKGTELQSSVLYSPRPSKHLSRTRVSTPMLDSSSSGPLGILLTPLGKAHKKDSDIDGSKKVPCDFVLKRFDDRYYQKRCSLPTSALNPSSSERTPKPLRKSKTTLKIVNSSTNAEPVELSVPQTSAAFSLLGSKLLRRFTFPDVKKTDKEAREGSCATHNEDTETPLRVLARSDTHPLGKNHSQVGSKPSIDSISAVKCEFDFHFKAAPSKANSDSAWE